MAHNDSHGGSHEEHGGVHLPDPSAWPFIVGIAALLLGLTLIWWSRERDNEIAGPLVGAAAVFTVVAAGGWAYEDGRMRRKAELGEISGGRNARYTQVITFSIAEEAATAARTKGGVIDALNGADSVVRDLAGFQDLRLTVSPAGAGPQQVLVETTWSDREGLSTYEESHRTLLDIITSHNEQVVAGSVQAFDMEVIRDTKDVAFKFGLGPAAGLLGALIIGGFMVGAGLSVFQNDAVVADGGGNGEPPPPSDPFAPEIDARDNFFPVDTITVAANAEITVTMHNLGRTPHNVTFYDVEGGSVLGGQANGNIAGAGETVSFSFTTPGVGEYFFRCDLHPDQMKGTWIVQEIAAPAEGGGEGAEAEAAE